MRQIFRGLAIVCVIGIASSTFCFECVSLNQHWCKEHFVGEDFSGYHDNIINCTGNCMKLVAHVGEKREFYVRTCDITEGHPNVCRTVSQVLGIPVSTVCVCDSDRCNGGNLARNIFLLTTETVLISLLFNV